MLFQHCFQLPVNCRYESKITKELKLQLERSDLISWKYIPTVFQVVCSQFSHPYPIALAVNKSPAVFVFLSGTLDELWRENRGCVNELFFKVHSSNPKPEKMIVFIGSVTNFDPALVELQVWYNLRLSFKFYNNWSNQPVGAWQSQIQCLHPHIQLVSRQCNHIS